VGYLNEEKLSYFQRDTLRAPPTVEDVKARKIGLQVSYLVELGLLELRGKQFKTTSRGTKALAQNLKVPR
jgi:hypothetical protein